MIRKITLGITLFFSTLMFASPAYADWVKVGANVGENGDGTTYYVDFERMRTNGGYVYYWRLEDYLEPNEYGTLSTIVYAQGDCDMFRNKDLSIMYYKQPMSKGSGSVYTPPNPEGIYPSPNSAAAIILRRVCRRAGL